MIEDYLPKYVSFMSLVSASQGLVLFFLLIQKKGNKSNIFFAFFVLTYSIYLAIYSDPTFQIIIDHPYLPFALDFVPYLHTPLLYFYFIYALNKNPMIRVPFIIHTIPAVLSFIVMGIAFLLNADNATEITRKALFEKPFLPIAISNWIKYLFGIFYGVLIFIEVKNYAANSPGWTKNKKQRNWLVLLTSAYSFCWVIIILTGLIIATHKLDEEIVITILTIQMLSLVAAMYIIAYFVLRHPNLFPAEQIRNRIARKLNIDHEKLAGLENQLTMLMNEKKSYLDENITLQSLARKMKLHPNVLSYVINEKFNKNFNEYINEFRINHFLTLASSGECDEKNILRLALESGFNSKTTFNRVFKKQHGIPPYEYLKQ